MSTKFSIFFLILFVRTDTTVGDVREQNNKKILFINSPDFQPGHVTIHHHYYFCGNTSTDPTKTNDLLSKGPENLQKFVGKKIRIKSPFYNEYLYTDTRAVVEKDRWSVFFARNKSYLGRQFFWTITPVNAYNEGFALANEWNTWLYTPVDRFLHDADRRRVFMWIPLDDYDYTGEWVFEPVPNNSKNFYVKSKHRGEYLYPYEDGTQSASSGRPIFTWIPKLTEFDLQMEWTFELVE
jgi:NADH:ubiquinone oxidoreductase subunit